jgi:hypothetical protein
VEVESEEEGLEGTVVVETTGEDVRGAALFTPGPATGTVLVGLAAATGLVLDVVDVGGLRVGVRDTGRLVGGLVRALVVLSCSVLPKFDAVVVVDGVVDVDDVIPFVVVDAAVVLDVVDGSSVVTSITCITDASLVTDTVDTETFSACGACSASCEAEG